MAIDYLLSNPAIAAAKHVIESAMSYTADIQRPTPSAPDGYGQPGAPTWVTNLLGQKCLVVSMALGSVRTGEQQDQNTAFVQDRHLLYLPFGVDIQVTDRISALYNRDGSLFDSTVVFFEIKERVPSEASLCFTIQAIH